MAKNFKGASGLVDSVARKSNDRANTISVKIISNGKLIDFPQNGEDITNTADLEASIGEMGFTDPIEVTTFGMAEGEYMIISGHRRRAAGVRAGMDSFPCIIRNFVSDNEVRNYVLMANSHRDSSKDPLLICRRYKMHEEFLQASGYEGSIRVEIARRLGISVQQADRYNQMSRVIERVWDLVADELVGMSSVLPLAVHSEEEQAEIADIFFECIENGDKLTRDMCDRIIKAYRDGRHTYSGIFEVDIEEPEADSKFEGYEQIEIDDGMEECGDDYYTGEFDMEDNYIAEESVLQSSHASVGSSTHRPAALPKDNNEEFYIGEEDYTEEETTAKSPLNSTGHSVPQEAEPERANDDVYTEEESYNEDEYIELPKVIAAKKIADELETFSGGQRETAISKFVASALIHFCEENERFEEAVASSKKTLSDCCKEVLKGCGSSVSDIDVYREAVRFYLPEAEVFFEISVRIPCEPVNNIIRLSF